MRNEDRLKAIEAGNCPHAILLAGAPESDRTEFARRAAARYLLHSDDTDKLATSPYYMEISEYATDSMRDMMQLIHAEAFGRGRRCVVLLQAHTMSTLVQNVLLKTLEEPPADTLLLLTGVEQGMLPTILSRCVIIRDETEPWEAIAKRLQDCGVERSVAEQCARRSDGVFGRAAAFAETESLTFRKKAIDCLELYRKGIRPLPEAAALCTRSEVSDEDGTKKRARVSAELVDAFFDVCLSILDDALHRKIGWAEENNSDCKPLVKNFADCFTIAQIQGMIATVLDGKQQLSFRATASMTLDYVLTKLP